MKVFAFACLFTLCSIAGPASAQVGSPPSMKLRVSTEARVNGVSVRLSSNSHLEESNGAVWYYLANLGPGVVLTSNLGIQSTLRNQSLGNFVGSLRILNSSGAELATGACEIDIDWNTFSSPDVDSDCSASLRLAVTGVTNPRYLEGVLTVQFLGASGNVIYSKGISLLRDV